MEILAHILVAAFVGVGMAIVLVEKRSQWPATAIRPVISWFLGKIYSKLPEMFDCTVCTSFWTAVIADAYLSFVCKCNYWLMPLSGFLAVTIMWSIIQLLNAIDPVETDKI